MPRAANGTGTLHYGRADMREDGSYIATVWVAVFFLPLIPLRSERVQPLSSYDNGAGRSWTRFAILGRVPLHRRQVALTYLAGWGTLFWYAGLFSSYDLICRLFGGSNYLTVVVCGLVVPFVILFVWDRWLMPRPKLNAEETLPGSDYSIYRASPPQEKTPTDSSSPRGPANS
jgi:hypothetical protein